MKENVHLKMCLTLQSFAPLFLLILVKRFQFDFFRAVLSFLGVLAFGAGDMSKRLQDAVTAVMSYQFLGDFAVSMLCVFWLVGATAVWVAFQDFQTVNFESYGEKIVVAETLPEGGASYFVTFVLPLMIDDVNTLRGFGVFSLLLIMLISLIVRSNLFYQNPVLAMLKYQVFQFTFLNPHSDITMGGKTYIGITKGDTMRSNAIIKRKYIAGDVFLIFGDQGGKPHAHSDARGAANQGSAGAAGKGAS